MKLKHIKWTQEVPAAVKIYNPDFRTMTDEQIIKQIEAEHQVKEILYSKNIATVFITK